MQLVIGRIAKAHGIGGEVSVDVRTDSPQLRFAPGTRVDTDPPERGPLTVARARWHTGRLLVAFEGVPDRSAAEALRGTLLVADASTSPAPTDPDEFWDHQLVDLEVVTVAGVPVGVVVDVLHTPGGDVLAVRRHAAHAAEVAGPGADGGGRGEVLVPFVKAIVPTVDLAGGRIVIDPPEGLLEL